MAVVEAYDPSQRVEGGIEQPDIARLVGDFQSTEDPAARALAFTGLVHATQGFVHGAALKVVHSAEDAQDVAQDVYSRVWKYLGGFKNQALFTTWLYPIVHNVAVKHVVAPKAVPFDPQGYVDESAVMGAPVASQEGVAIFYDEYKPLYRAVGKLSLLDKEIIRLKYVEELTHEEIADKLNISVSNSKVRLHRAQKQLRGSLESQKHNLIDI